MIIPDFDLRVVNETEKRIDNIGAGREDGPSDEVSCDPRSPCIRSCVTPISSIKYFSTNKASDTHPRSGDDLYPSMPIITAQNLERSTVLSGYKSVRQYWTSMENTRLTLVLTELMSSTNSGGFTLYVYLSISVMW